MKAFRKIGLAAVTATAVAAPVAADRTHNVLPNRSWRCFNSSS